jgi:hypothetical protein
LKTVAMKVRIRFTGVVSGIGGSHRPYRQFALAAGALLNPASLSAWLLGFWRIGAALSWTGPFPIPSGMFSHWHVWFAVAILLQLCSRMLNRYGRRRDHAAF